MATEYSDIIVSHTYAHYHSDEFFLLFNSSLNKNGLVFFSINIK